MKDLGAAKKILGIEIQRDQKAGKLYLSQSRYLDKCLDRFNMCNCKAVSTPFVVHFRLFAEYCPQSKQNIKKMSRVPYSSVVGSLMYAMICTWPDL